MPDSFIVPPPGTLGVWCDVRPLEDYPDVRQRRGPAPRAVLACREAVLGWHHGSLPGKLLAVTRERIRGLAAAAAVLAVRRERHSCDPFVPLEAPAEVPAEVPVCQPARQTQAPANVAQDDFMEALAAVFGRA